MCDHLSKATHKSRWSYTYRNFEIAHNKLFFKETTYSNLKVLKQDDESIEGAMFVCKSSTLSCQYGKKSLKPYLLKHKNKKQTRTKKMDTFTLATRCKPSGRFNINYSNALRNLQFSCRYRRVFYQLSQL